MATEQAKSTRSFRSTRQLGALVDFLNTPKYLVTKKFVAGGLKGLQIKEKTAVSFEVGKAYGIYGDRYEVVSCEALEGSN